MGNDETALVQFKETVIDEFNEPYHKQQFKLLVREIGKRYNNIVLRVLHTEVELFKDSLTNIFLKAVFIENRVRWKRNSNPIKIYILASLKVFLYREHLGKNQFQEWRILDYILNEGNIFGVIFENFIILTPISDKNMLVLTVKKVISLMSKLKVQNGYELNFGLAISSLHICASFLEKVFRASFDMVVYTHEVKDISQSEPKTDVCIKKCIKLYESKFPKFAFYKVQTDLEITLI